MPERVFNYVIEGTDKSAPATKAVTKNLAGVQKQLQAVAGSMNKWGASLSRSVTAPLVGLGTVSVKMASDLESAFAGVIKTTDGLAESSGELTDAGKELRGQFRDLAAEVPMAVEELMGIGELGGQLGVAKDDLLGFTEVIAAMGVATNLTVDDAATQFAQLGNIMDTTEFDRMGSAIVALGNDSATTEADISAFASRISGAGKIAGLTTADVFGISAAFASVGIQAEAGGTATQKVLMGMNAAVADGGDDLASFAKAAGMSAEEFSTLWEKDAAGAFTEFVEGLGEAGDDAMGLLADLGLEDQRLVRAFLSLSNASGLLAKSVNTANDAWEENTALSKEAGQRYATFESQMSMFKNTLKDLAATAGEILLPILRDLMEKLIPWIRKLSVRIKELSPQAKRWALAFVGVLAAIGPVLLILGKIVGVAAALANPIGLAVIAVGALAAGFVRLMGGIGPMMDKFRQLRDWVLTKLPYALNIFRTIWASAWAAVRVAWDSVASGAIERLQSALGALRGLMDILSTGLKGDWPQAWEMFKGAVTKSAGEVASSLRTKLQAAVDVVRGLLEGGLPGILDRAKATLKDRLIPVISTAITTAWDWLTTVAPTKLAELGARLWGIVKGAFDWVKDKLSGKQELGVGLFDSEKAARAAATEPGLAQKLATGIGDLLSDVWDKVTTTGATLGAKIAELLTNAWEIAKTTAVTAALSLVDLLFGSDTGGDDPSRADELAELIKGMVSAAWGKITAVGLAALDVVDLLFGTDAKPGDRAALLAKRISELAKAAWAVVTAPVLAALDLVTLLFGGDPAKGPGRAKQLATSIGELIGKAWGLVVSTGLGAIDLVGELFGGEAEGAGVGDIKTRAQELATKVGTLLDEAWKIIKKTGLGAIDLVGELFGADSTGTDDPSRASALATQVSTMISTAWGAVTGTGEKLGTAVRGILDSAWTWLTNNPGETAANLWTSVSGILSGAWALVTDTGETLGAKVGEILTAAWGFISSDTLVTDLYNVVAGNEDSFLRLAWDKITTEATNLAVFLGEAVKALVLEAWKWLIDHGPDEVDELYEVVGGETDSFLTKAWDKIAAGAEKLGALLGTAVKSVVLAAWTWLKDKGQVAFTGVKDWLSGLFGGDDDAAATGDEESGLGGKLRTMVEDAWKWAEDNAVLAWDWIKGLFGAEGKIAKGAEKVAESPLGKRLKGMIEAGWAWATDNAELITYDLASKIKLPTLKIPELTLADVLFPAAEVDDGSTLGQRIFDALSEALGWLVSKRNELSDKMFEVLGAALAPPVTLAAEGMEDVLGAGPMEDAAQSGAFKFGEIIGKAIFGAAMVLPSVIGVLADSIVKIVEAVADDPALVKRLGVGLARLIFRAVKGALQGITEAKGALDKAAVGALSGPFEEAAGDTDAVVGIRAFVDLWDAEFAKLSTDETTINNFASHLLLFFRSLMTTAGKLFAAEGGVWGLLFGGTSAEGPGRAALGSIDTEIAQQGTALRKSLVGELGQGLAIPEADFDAKPMVDSLSASISTEVTSRGGILGIISDAIFGGGAAAAGDTATDIGKSSAGTNVSGIDLSVQGTNAANSFGNAISEYNIAVHTDALSTSLTTEVAKITLLEQGKTIADSLLTGIEDRWGKEGDKGDTLIGKVYQGATELLNTVDEVFTMGSPSGEMKKRGAWIPEGFALGIEEATPGVSTAVDDLMGSIVDPVERAGDPLGIGLEGITVFFDSILTWLTKFAQELGVVGLHEAAESMEEFGDGVKDLGMAFNNISEAIVRARDLQPDEMISFLDQYKLFAKQANAKMVEAYHEIGKGDLQKGHQAAKRLGEMLGYISQDLSEVKPGEWGDLMLFLDQFKWLATQVSKTIMAIVLGENGALGIGAIRLEALAEWAGYLSEILGIIGHDLSGIKASEAGDFGTEAGLYITQLGIFAKLVGAEFGYIAPELKAAYKLASEVAGYVEGMAGILGVNLKIELPDEDPTSKIVTLLGYVQSAAPLIVAAMNDIHQQFGVVLDDEGKIVEDAQSVLDIASETVGKISAAFGILGVNLEAEAPAEGFLDALKLRLAGIEAGVPSVLDSLERLDTAYGTRLTTELLALSDKITSAFGVLSTNLEAETPAESFVETLKLRLAGIERGIPLVLDSLERLDATYGTRLTTELQALSGKITSAFGIIGVNLKAEAPAKSFIETLKLQLAGIEAGAPLVLDSLEAMDKLYGKRLTTELQALSGKITSAFGILGVGLNVEAPEADFLSNMTQFLDDLLIAAPLVFDKLDEVIAAIKVPEGSELTKDEMMQRFADVAGWINSTFGVLGVSSAFEGLVDRKATGKALKTHVQGVMDDLKMLMPIVTKGLSEIDVGWGAGLEAVQSVADKIKALFQTIADTMEFVNAILYDQKLNPAALSTIFNSFIKFLNSPGLLPVLKGAGMYEGALPGLPSTGETMDPTGRKPKGKDGKKDPGATKTVRILVEYPPWDALTDKEQYDIALGVDRKTAEFEVEV